MTYRSVFRPDLFADRVVVVTGGGSGIGRCIAHELASLGAQVVLLGRTASKLVTVVDEITEDGGRARQTTCDIRDEEQVTAAVAWTLEQVGRIDGLVNNAGGQFPSTISDMSLKGFDAVIRNNLGGTFLMMREVHRQWMADHGGSIVNITAEHRNGFPGMGHTGAARAGVANLTMTTAVEWAPQGVRVNEVAPGTIASSGINSYETWFQEIFASSAANVPLGRLGTEAEVSGTVCFLLSEAAAFVTGACLRVDGAASLASHRNWPVGVHDRAPAFDGFHRSELPEPLRRAVSGDGPAAG